MRTLRALVTGGSGFLGGRLLRRLASEALVLGTFSRSARPGLPLVRLDVRDARATHALFAEHRFDVCVHAAASCDVAWCEAHPEEAEALNVGGTRHVVDACRAHGVRLIYISTDHIYGGRPLTAYTEVDAPRPLQRYGATKLAGERLAVALPGALSLRLPLLYGAPAPEERPSFLAKALHALRAGETFPADDVAVRYPVLVDDAADLVAHLVAHPAEGVLNYSSDEGVTKLAWARRIAAHLGLDPDRVTARPEGGAAARPQDNRLASIRLREIGVAPPRPVQRALQDLFPEGGAR